jgi:hypothetical protein
VTVRVVQWATGAVGAPQLLASPSGIVIAPVFGAYRAAPGVRA